MQKLALTAAAVLAVAALGAGCKDEDRAQSTTPTTPPSAAPTTAATAPGSGDHARLPIGDATVGSLRLVATMDAPVKPGGEGAFDVVITGGKPKAVRFWVGTETAEGSVKAKAEEETPDNWHTHAEVPNPIPPGSKFWVEVEPPTGEKFTRSFELKVQ